ncbi:MAG: hypothetical protein IJU28_04430 [Clostridia bacterium]|nr:hypothetical protein [Clostridia bacterium]
MFRMLCFEGRKTVQSISLWVIFIIMLAISFLYARSTFSKFPEMLYNYDHPSSGISISRGEYVFYRTMGDASFTAWMSVIAGALLIGLDFQRRTINHLIYAGHRRISIVIVKLFYFYLSAILLSALYPIIACLLYSTKWLSGLSLEDANYVWRCIACRPLNDMAMMSFSLVMVFLFKDVVRSLIGSLIITVGLSLLLGAMSGTGFITEYFPARAIRAVMERNASAETIQNALCYSAVMVGITAITCSFLFRQADLK